MAKVMVDEEYIKRAEEYKALYHEHSDLADKYKTTIDVRDEEILNLRTINQVLTEKIRGHR